MQAYIEFFFTICMYTFAVLFVLILVARFTKPHSLKVLHYLKGQFEKGAVSKILYLVCIISGGIISLALINSYSFYKIVDIAVGCITGAFIPFMLQAVVRFLPEYLEDKQNDDSSR